MKKKNIFSSFLWIIIAGLVFTACSKNSSNTGGGTAGTDPNTIYMKNAVFSNTNLQVLPGTKVTWINDDTMIHTVTADDGSFNSGDIASGASYSFTFTTGGTYLYHCRYHINMKGAILVTGIR